jgi:HSP20 family protein
MRHTSIKINPLPEKELLKKEVGQLSVDIYHTENEIVLLAPIAGVKEADVKISITDDVLVIKGERKAREEVSEDAYYTRECFWGNFSRSIVLPEEADSKNIAADFEDSVLEIRIPKMELEHTKIIKIKSNKK